MHVGATNQVTYRSGIVSDVGLSRVSHGAIETKPTPTLVDVKRWVGGGLGLAMF